MKLTKGLIFFNMSLGLREYFLATRIDKKIFILKFEY